MTSHNENYIEYAQAASLETDSESASAVNWSFVVFFVLLLILIIISLSCIAMYCCRKTKAAQWLILACIALGWALTIATHFDCQIWDVDEGGLSLGVWRVYSSVDKECRLWSAEEEAIFGDSGARVTGILASIVGFGSIIAYCLTVVSDRKALAISGLVAAFLGIAFEGAMMGSLYESDVCDTLGCTGGTGAYWGSLAIAYWFVAIVCGLVVVIREWLREEKNDAPIDENIP